MATKVRPPLTDTQRDLANGFYYLAKNIIRPTINRYPLLEDVLYDAAMDALLQTARHFDPKLGNFVTLLHAKMRSTVLTCLQHSRPVGFRTSLRRTEPYPTTATFEDSGIL